MSVDGLTEAGQGSSPVRPGPPPDMSEGPAVVAVRVQLFLSSYLPLFVILAVRFDSVALKALFGVFAGIGALDLFMIFVVVARGTAPQHPYVERVQDASGEVAGYLASYLLPFVTVSSPTTTDLIGYGIYLLVLLAIFVRSDLSQINPTLYLLGYRVAVITIGDVERYLICRRIPRVPRTLEVVPVAGLLIYKARHGTG